MLTQRGVGSARSYARTGTSARETPVHACLAGAHLPRTRAAAQYLGIRDVVFLGHNDGELEPSLRLRAQIAQQYRRFQPDTR
jgi:LmbE family N-acetylglucosaminyl deacetylase